MRESHNVRFDHAYKRFGDLCAIVTEWTSGQHHEVIREYHADREPPMFEVSVRVEEPPLETFGLLISEIVSNLRMGLDNLAYAFAIENSGEPLPPDIAAWSEFPIIGNRSRAGNPTDGAKRWPEVRAKQLGGVSDHVADVIEFWQPYNVHIGFEWDHSPIWWLHELACADKHRLLLPVIAQSSGGKFDPTDAYFSCKPIPGTVEIITTALKPETPTVVGRFPVIPLIEGVTDYMDVKFDPMLCIRLDERAPVVSDYDLVDTLEAVFRCLDRVLAPLID